MKKIILDYILDLESCLIYIIENIFEFLSKEEEEEGYGVFIIIIIITIIIIMYYKVI